MPWATPEALGGRAAVLLEVVILQTKEGAGAQSWESGNDPQWGDAMRRHQGKKGGCRSLSLGPTRGLVSFWERWLRKEMSSEASPTHKQRNSHSVGPPWVRAGSLPGHSSFGALEDGSPLPVNSVLH